MTTIDREPEAVRGQRGGRRADHPEFGRPTVWQQRIPGPQLPGFVSGVTLVAGIWLVLAPLAWNYGEIGVGLDASRNDLLLGLVVTALGAVRLAGRIRLLLATALGIAAGLWLLVAPFALAYGFGADSTRATINDLVVGLLVVIVTVIGHTGARMTLPEELR